MSRVYFEKTKKYKLMEYNPKENAKLLEELANTDKEMVSLMTIDKNLSYFITNACNELLGAITIEKQEHNPNLVIYLDLINNFLITSQIKHNNDVTYLITTLIDYLARINYEKTKVVVRLPKVIDLTYFSNLDCKKRLTASGSYEYIFDNNKYHQILAKLVKEIELTQANLWDWNTYWQEKLYDEKGKGSNNPNNDLLDIKTKMCLFPCVGLNGITTKSGVRNIYFKDDGTIKYQKTSHKKTGKNQYEFNCDLMHETFNFASKNLDDDNNETLKTYVSSDKQIYEESNDTVRYDIVEKNNIRQIMVNNANIVYFLQLNGDIINQAFIQFKTHKTNGKINGFYQLKLNRSFPGIELWHISRKGKKYDLMPFLQEVDSYLGTDLLKLQFRVEDFNNLLKRLIVVCNKFASKHNGKKIVNPNIKDIMDILVIEDNTKEILKGIEEEIPLPTLQAMVHGFNTDVVQKCNHQTRCRGKKRQEQLSMI